MQKRTVVIGEMDNSDGTFESANRVYDSKATAPTIPTCGGGGIQPKVIKKVSVTVESVICGVNSIGSNTE